MAHDKLKSLPSPLTGLKKCGIMLFAESRGGEAPKGGGANGRADTYHYFGIYRA